MSTFEENTHKIQVSNYTQHYGLHFNTDRNASTCVLMNTYGFQFSLAVQRFFSSGPLAIIFVHAA